jgi:hypothetical protein
MDIDKGAGMRDERGAIGMGRAATTGGARPRPMRGRLVAVPVFDSRVGPRASGVRGLQTAFPRLMYTAGGFEVDVRIRPCSTVGPFRLLGQVLDPDFEPCAGRVRVEGAYGAVEADLDDCGHFSVGGLTSSGHRLEIRLADVLIEIPTVYV